MLSVGWSFIHALDQGHDLTAQAATPNHVLITAKRLDADEREQIAVEVDAPGSEAEQRTQLIELVRARYPDAEFRSFANEAASFLAHKLLVVAVYRRSTERVAEDNPEPDDGSQQQLFAA
jgi:hypothetical protein